MASFGEGVADGVPETKRSVSYGPLDATFTGRLGADGNCFSGGWRPNPGADETANIPYDITGMRIE